MIRVLVVDDSTTICRIIKIILEEDPEIEVIGTACDPYEARDKIFHLKPDVISLDIDMPRMNGIKFLRMLMRHHPLPVIIISSFTADNPTYLMALENGALEVVNKTQLMDADGQRTNKLRNLFKAAGQAHIRRMDWKMNSTVSQDYNVHLPYTLQHVIGIGASAGGPETLVNLLKALPPCLPGILIVQHMPEAFALSFAQRLNEISPFHVAVTRGNEPVKPGQVWLAAGQYHLGVKKQGGKIVTTMLDLPPENYHRPSVDVLFRSMAETCSCHAVGILLSGMGNDGARGMLTLKQSGAATIAQDEASSVVYGMPKAAAELDAAQHVLPLTKIPHRLVEIFKQKLL